MNALRRIPGPGASDGEAARRHLTLAPLELSASFRFDGHRIEYTEFGHGDRVVVLAHGFMMTRRMHRPLARRLARDGFRVVTVDLLGHGGSDRPDESWRYSMTAFGEQVVALLGHLGVDKAVVGGTSLGANVALEVAALAPGRLRGLLVEMPALDNALFAGLLAYPPVLFAARFAPVTVRAVRRAASLVPHGNQWVDIVTDSLKQDPRALTALLHGVLFNRVAPPRSIRRELTTPALIIGHARDPIHPFGDADKLAIDMPCAQFVRARGPVELRFKPERLTQLILAFLEERFASVAAA